MLTKIKDARSGVASENLQEIMDAAVSAKHALQGGQQQYQTPTWLAKSLATLLPASRWGGGNNMWADGIIDPQGAEGNLVKAVTGESRYVFEIDNRLKTGDDDQVKRITGNCVRIGELLDELFSHYKVPCVVANPPFGIRWKTKDGSIDSTQWTWDFILKRLAPNGFGFIISNVDTLRRMGVDKHHHTYLFQEFPAGGIWEDCNVKLGVAHFHAIHSTCEHTKVDHVWDHVPTAYEIEELSKKITRCDNATCHYRMGGEAFIAIADILKEEKEDRGKFNVSLGKNGRLRTYLSTYNAKKMPPDDIARLHRINNCHPLTLTTEKETRKILDQVLNLGIYTIEPSAKAAIAQALKDVFSAACPITPATDFELVAYGDEQEELTCVSIEHLKPEMRFTVGNKYSIYTSTYSFQDSFVSKKLAFDQDDESECWMEEHDMQLNGQDRFIEVADDHGRKWRFMDRPPKEMPWCLGEDMLWKIFAKPDVKTVAEALAPIFQRNKSILDMHSMMSGFTYFPGQHDYVARLGCKDYALVGADVGTGKTLIALSLIQLKSPKRTLIIAPQGTMRSSGDEDEMDYQPSQWVTEIRRFAPGEPVFQLFSLEDYRAVLHANGGEFPAGIYITYPQALWQNGAFEALPASWEKKNPEKLFRKQFNLNWDDDEPVPAEQWVSAHIGLEQNGIRCVAYPSLATTIAAEQPEWDCVIIDEAHLCANPDSRVTRNLLRLQPKFRFALTATPIPNYVNNIFSLMGWLCVPDWYKGEVLNVAWPYALEEEARFKNTFMCTEIDLTLQERARAKGDKSWKQKGAKKCAVISSPARLLKLLKPNMAYISKEACNPKQVKCDVIDVRVPLGSQQQVIYEYWMNRENLRAEFPNAMTRALTQLQRLRGVTASPLSTDYKRVNLGTVDNPEWFELTSDFNSKTITILQLIRDRLSEGEQVVVVSARCGQSDELQRRLTEAGVPTARIDSSIQAHLHTAEANRFKRGDARVMLMGIKCAQGHSFEKCRNLIIGSLEWSYGSLHQAKGRVWRLTSQRDVRIWCVLHENTIEELLFDRVAMKQDAATICLHGKRVPRSYTQQDAAEVLADHIVNYRAQDGRIMSEAECESQWPALRDQIIVTVNPNVSAA